MQAFEQQLREAGYLAMGGQIVDTTLVPAPKQRNTDGEKAAIKASKSAKQIWRGKPNKAHRKDLDARWTVKIGGKIRYRPDGTPLPQIATPVFGYKSHISIDRVSSSSHDASQGHEIKSDNFEFNSKSARYLPAQGGPCRWIRCGSASEHICKQLRHRSKLVLNLSCVCEPTAEAACAFGRAQRECRLHIWTCAINRHHDR